MWAHKDREAHGKKQKEARSIRNPRIDLAVGSTRVHQESSETSQSSHLALNKQCDRDLPRKPPLHIPQYFQTESLIRNPVKQRTLQGGSKKSRVHTCRGSRLDRIRHLAPPGSHCHDSLRPGSMWASRDVTCLCDATVREVQSGRQAGHDDRCRLELFSSSFFFFFFARPGRRMRTRC